ncbi:MAG TPA: alpha/beta fold hydrolase [Xanthobacteraceae bacterium]|nr:alpha/beta fold hydrolase [Xanthobacteraceae bacterium]
MSEQLEDVLLPAKAAEPDVLAIVSEIWARALGRKGRVPNANLVRIGVGGKRIMQIVDEIESALGVRIPLGVALKLGTAEAIAEAIKTRRWPARSPLLLMKDGGDDGRLYLLAGGHGIIIEVCYLGSAVVHPGKTFGLQPPGFEGEVPKLASVQDLAAYYVDHLPGNPDEPINIVGFSFGGLVALEIARILDRRGRKLGLIGMIDTHLAERQWPAATRIRFLWGRVIGRLRAFGQVPPGRRVDAIRNSARPLLKVFKRLFSAVSSNPALSHYYQPYIDARIKAVKDLSIVAFEKYAPEPVAFPVVLFKSKRDARDIVDTEEIWRPIIPQLEVVENDGKHASMIMPPLVDQVAAEIASRLAR